jgi:hypothetical protein
VPGWLSGKGTCARGGPALNLTWLPLMPALAPDCALSSSPHTLSSCALSALGMPVPARSLPLCCSWLSRSVLSRRTRAASTRTRACGGAWRPSRQKTESRKTGGARRRLRLGLGTRCASGPAKTQRPHICSVGCLDPLPWPPSIHPPTRAATPSPFGAPRSVPDPALLRQETEACHSQLSLLLHLISGGGSPEAARICRVSTRGRSPGGS